MKLTSNYSLKKPDGSDVVNVQDFNDNSDKIDLELKKVDSSLKDIANKVDNIKIADGTTTTKGIVKLNNSINSTSTTDASTPNATKQAYDKGVEALNKANEAFTSASNGKNYIAGKVGNVTGGNTFTQIGDKIQNNKNIIANILNSKGISAVGTEILNSLAGKIDLIKTLPGVSAMNSGTYVQNERFGRYSKIKLPATACGTGWNVCFGNYSGWANGTFCCYIRNIERGSGYCFFSDHLSSSPNVAASTGGWNLESSSWDRGSNYKPVDATIYINWYTVKF
ncbi:phage tail protein [Clostridium cagae]|uniref:phage tail protein n=1 Tax=Clostridium cagae TaxID=2080751 RepID=UPI000CF70FCD|nr:phage tail protein [Clostridium cagae]